MSDRPDWEPRYKLEMGDGEKPALILDLDDRYPSTVSPPLHGWQPKIVASFNGEHKNEMALAAWEKMLPPRVEKPNADDLALRRHLDTRMEGENIEVTLRGTLGELRGLWSNLGEKARLEVVKSVILTAPDCQDFCIKVRQLTSSTSKFQDQFD